MGQKFEKIRPNFSGVLHMSKNNIGHVFSFKNVFIWVLSRPCFQGKLATISFKANTQRKKFLNEKTWPMLFFDICETPEKIWPHFFKFLAYF